MGFCMDSQSWFIPARAGNMKMQAKEFGAVNGSSPLVRGTFAVSAGLSTYMRFIPARAGNICWCSGKSWYDSVHPRSCGEHAMPAALTASNTGSSPLVRGTCWYLQEHCCCTRFIPARAGNICLTTPFDNGLIGSSPLVRGTFCHRTPDTTQTRFIPARAGNIIATRKAISSLTVHPRSCGEHLPVARSLFPDSGSSPLVRGT